MVISDDDKQIIQLPELTRRSLLAGSLGGFFVCSARGRATAIVTSKNRVRSPSCSLAPEQTEGPYYVDGALLRSNITEGRSGIPLRLRIVILDGQRCIPLLNAAVSIWHCDASGVYSGFTANSPDGPPMPPPGMRSGATMMRNGPPGPPPPGFEFRGMAGGHPPPPFHHGAQDKTRFFRGVQMTDASGAVEFVTIYPGWYVGRDTHIHLKVFTQGSVSTDQYQGGHVCHTGQLFFPDELSDAVARLSPYASHHAKRTRQEDDDIFTSQHGSEFVLSLEQNNRRSMAEGFRTQVAIGVDPNAEPAPVGFGGGPPPFVR